MISKQWAAIAATVLACGAIIYLLVPKQPKQSLQVRLVRVVSGSQDVGADGKTGGLTEDEVNELKSLGVTGTLRASSGTSVSHRPFTPRASVIVVFTGDLRSPMELREPQATHVMYVQQGDAWKMYPADAPTVRYEIKFWPSETDPRIIEVQSGSFRGSFSWYPPIF
ncbi:MAG: hypothetical protein ACLQMT_07230 [Candidatus Acidiferrales bacterium]